MKFWNVSLLICLSTLFFATSAQAQTMAGAKLQGGLSTVSFTGDNENTSIDTKLGFGFGAVVDLAINKNLSIRPELAFVQRGYSVDFLGVVADLNLNYIQLPILLNAKIQFGQISPKLLIGPYASVFLFGNQSLKSGDNTETKDLEDDSISRVDAGVMVAPGVDLEIAGLTFSLDFRFERGLLDLSSDNNGDDSVHNTAYSVNLGVMFPFGS